MNEVAKQMNFPRPKHLPTPTCCRSLKERSLATAVPSSSHGLSVGSMVLAELPLLPIQLSHEVNLNGCVRLCIFHQLEIEQTNSERGWNVMDANLQSACQQTPLQNICRLTRSLYKNFTAARSMAKNSWPKQPASFPKNAIQQVTLRKSHKSK